jgi:hypothetical protein
MEEKIRLKTSNARRTSPPEFCWRSIMMRVTLCNVAFPKNVDTASEKVPTSASNCKNVGILRTPIDRSWRIYPETIPVPVTDRSACVVIGSSGKPPKVALHQFGASFQQPKSDDGIAAPPLVVSGGRVGHHSTPHFCAQPCSRVDYTSRRKTRTKVPGLLETTL